MDLLRLRKDFEGLTPEDQMQFMASVGPAFCRKVMADPALRRQMMAQCVGGKCKVGAIIGGRLAAAQGMAQALRAGWRAGIERWRQAPAAAAGSKGDSPQPPADFR